MGEEAETRGEERLEGGNVVGRHNEGIESETG